jgi:AGCS family alanine or glycine:cation symporter
MGGSIAEWFNSIVNYGVSIIWGNNDWLIASNP